MRCHLKGKFRGVMMAATSLDGNNGLFPVAFGIAESENSDSWTWFLEALKESIQTPEGLVLVSDRQKGLEEAVQHIYPQAEHRKCMRHLYKNFQTKFQETGLKLRYGELQGHIQKSNMTISSIKLRRLAWRHSSILMLKILAYGVDLSLASQPKCSYITNNLSESFNAWISEARHRPVLDLLDVVRQKIMVKMEARRRMAARWKGNLVPVVMKYVRDISLKLGDYNVYRTSDYRAEVIETNGRHEVILNEQRCSCRLWEVSGIPCVHAAAFICSMRGANLENYVSEYFTVAKYKTAYALEIGPLPHKVQWIKVDIGHKVLPPKLSLRPPGRPKKKRIRGTDENTSKKMHKCKRCGDLGHHAKTCKNSVVEESQASMSSSSAPKKLGR
ncbi:uncharacterized protein LOC120110401 [Phoenix dactylifera]|uniref:Uncharacterized protein LOC120110401 n=1 Tax=Phoenix dactylifera TaxID=42345 RepID=A0A8B9A3E3_PHODC|nr:uncharacterized protein LOC120110401 [Phoenix dactylifera]